MNPVNLKITKLHLGTNFVCFGLPLKKGSIVQCDQLSITDHTDSIVDSVITPTNHWPDGSVKWCLIKASLVKQSGESTNLTIRKISSSATPPRVTTKESDDSIVVTSGNTEVHFAKHENRAFPTIVVAGSTVWATDTVYPSLTDENDTRVNFTADNVYVKEHDFLSSTCVVSGSYEVTEKKLNVKFTFEIFPDGQLNLLAELHNPQRAIHPGGLWDLGDPGSVNFKDFSLVLGTDMNCQPQMKVESHSNWINCSEPTTLFQASSGGAEWDSPTHVNASGTVCNQFRGYQFTNDETTTEGSRANPVLNIESTKNQNYTINIKNFWQNFPKCIEFTESKLSLRLFPGQHGDLHELQGGERKIHEIFFNFNPAKTPDLQHARPITMLDAQVYRNAGVFRYFDQEQTDQLYDRLLEPSLNPSNGFLAKRELTDEFGWRHYGELYADHEANYHSADSLFVSHYNNQYDSIGGFARQYALTGNPVWYQLMSELAEHVMDIDIYRTEQDRIEYNHGLFWHTDHYAEAKTATHRTYSARQKDENGNPSNGGGPGPHHCYTAGLTHYYFMTGNKEAREAVLRLGEWVHNYMEGSGTLMEAAQKTLKNDSKEFINTCKGAKVFKYTYLMDRGTGNYLRTLMDCYDITGDGKYLHQVEHVIKNTAGPSDEIDARDLDQPEYTWFYIIFLQEVVRYLDLKRELDQFDNNFYNARATLLHYARWMVENEEPYLANPDRLDFPNSTWTAQEPRKVHVLYAAYRYSLKDRTPFLEKARFFRDHLTSELAQADTLHYARIQALLLQNHGPSAFLDVDSLPYPGVRGASVPNDTDCFHTPGSHLKVIAKTWASSLWKFRIGKEIRWIKTRSK